MHDGLTAVRPVRGEEHFLEVEGKRVFLWEKRAPEGPANGTILFVHGSSIASLATFDLRVPGRPEASMMDWFASRGFDTWCFDCRGYGRSYKGAEILATIAEGAVDAAAVSAYIMAKRNTGPLFVYGVSSGALRAGLFAQNHPECVRSLVLDGMVWTGEGSRTLEQRRKRLPDWTGSTRRPIDRTFIDSITTRDGEGIRDEAFCAALAEQVLEHDDSMPNGSYIDMCANLPVVDPERITVPTLMLRGEHDGIATLDDLLAFFGRLKTSSKEFVILQAVSHATFLSKNHMFAYHVLHSFLTRPNLKFKG